VHGGGHRRSHGSGEELREGLVAVIPISQKAREKSHGTRAEATIEKGLHGSSPWRETDGGSRRRRLLPRRPVPTSAARHPS